MSPEHLVSTKSVDARSDIWALGVILYELLTGKPPFSGESMPELVAAIIQSDPVGRDDGHDTQRERPCERPSRP